MGISFYDLTSIFDLLFFLGGGFVKIGGLLRTLKNLFFSLLCYPFGHQLLPGYSLTNYVGEVLSDGFFFSSLLFSSLFFFFFLSVFISSFIILYHIPHNSFLSTVVGDSRTCCLVSMWSTSLMAVGSYVRPYPKKVKK